MAMRRSLNKRALILSSVLALALASVAAAEPGDTAQLPIELPAAIAKLPTGTTPYDGREWTLPQVQTFGAVATKAWQHHYIVLPLRVGRPIVRADGSTTTVLVGTPTNLRGLPLAIVVCGASQLSAPLAHRPVGQIVRATVRVTSTTLALVRDPQTSRAALLLTINVDALSIPR